MSVCLSIRAKRRIWSKRVFMRTNCNFSFGVRWRNSTNSYLIRNLWKFTLAARGLEEPFFQLCCCVSVFWFWREIGFGVTYVLRVQYSCGIVLVFWFWQEIAFGFAYVLSVQYSCAVVSVFWLWRERVFVWSKKNSYWVSLFYRNNAITKVYFS
jgi:hypothetical protein